MLSGPEPLYVLARSSKRILHYSVGGALGPAWAKTNEQPECSEAYYELQDCHWNLMQGVSQLLQFNQIITLSRKHPLSIIGRQIACQAHQLDVLYRQTQGLATDYILGAMELDQSLQDFHDIVEEEL